MSGISWKRAQTVGLLSQNVKNTLMPDRNFLLIIIGVAVFHVASLTYFPPVFVDEAWLVSRASAWLNTGINFGPLDAGVFDKKLEGYGTFYPIIPTLLLSVFIHWFGLTVNWLRLLPLLCGFGLLVATFSIANQISFSRRSGLVAVLLVSTSHSFLVSAHLIRYDIFVAALGYGAIAVVIAGCRRHSSSLFLVAGLMMSLAFEVHVNAAIFGPIILTLMVAQCGWSILGSRQFGVFAFGVFIGLVTYLWMHVAQHPTTFFTMGKVFTLTHSPPILSASLIQPWSFLRITGGYWIYLTSGRILITALAAVTLYRAKCESSKVLFLTLVFGLIAFSLLIRNRMFYYAILIGPLSDIFLAVWIHEISRKNVELGFWLKRAKAFGIATLIVTLAVPVFIVFSTPQPGDLELIGTRVKRFVPSNATIMGPPTYWFELHGHPYLSWVQILAHRLFDSSSSIDTALDVLRPDFLIIDDDMRQYILSDRSEVPRSGFDRYIWDRRLTKEELDSFLARRAELVDSFVTPTYGAIQIYSIHWGHTTN
jgi:hypothetical protein